MDSKQMMFLKKIKTTVNFKILKDMQTYFTFICN